MAAGLTVDERCGGGRVDYTIQGPRADVDAMTAAFVRQFHPAGYGTTFREPIETEPGIWRTTGFRRESCD